MALSISGVECEIREIKLSAKPAEMLRHSPKATVPVFVFPDGGVIDESMGIMRWALRQNDPEHWLGRDDPALIAVNDGLFKHHLDRYKYPQRYSADPLPHRTAGLAIMADIDAQLAQQGGNLRGPSRGLADIALFPFARQFAATDTDWFSEQRLPALHNWLATLTGSALFAVTMAKRPLWIQPSDLFQ